MVWIPPGQKHWHGAAPNSSMAHIAIVEQLDGRPCKDGKVSDAPIRRSARAQGATSMARSPAVSRAIGDFAPKLAE